MSNQNRNWILRLVFLFLVILQISTGCKQEQKAKISKSTETNKSNKVQVVLKRQSEPYNLEIHDKVISDYVDVTRLSIPKSLTPTNKWIMFEGPVLENDKVAYRFYADARHRFDIYGKKVSDLVMDTVSWDYHKIMDWGSDILKVGSTLGIGSPAIYYQDSVYCFENWDKKEIEVINSDSQTATVRTTFYGLKIGDTKMNVQQDWSLSEGDYYATIDLKRTDGDLPESMAFATGTAKHLVSYSTGHMGGYYYGHNWGLQSFHKQNLGMAIISSDKYSPRYGRQSQNHLTIFDKSKNGVQYHFLSVWANGVGAIDNEADFRKQMKAAISKISTK